MSMIPTPISLQSKDNGALTIFEKCPFPIQRVFFIQNVRKLSTRGNHAHKFCEQFIFPLAGSFELTTKSFVGDFASEVDVAQSVGWHIPPMNWVKIRILRPKTIIGVLCSLPYNEEDYIRDEHEFNRAIQRFTSSAGSSAN